MPQINLLPCRPDQRKGRKLAFRVALGGGTFAALLATFVIYLLFSSLISGQQERNEKLKAEIASLLQQAANIRSGVAGAGAKAQDRRDRGLTDAERESLNARRASDALSEAERMSTFAQNAQIDGRAEKAQQYAQRAADLIKQASDYADRLKDDSSAASLFDRIAEAEASALEAQAATKKQQLADVQATSAAQAEQLTALENRIAALKGEAASVKVQADVEAAKAGLDEVKAKVDALPDKKVIEIAWVSSGEGPRSPTPVETAAGFATGGHVRGPGTGTSDSILARLSNGEFVVRAAAVRHYGAGFLAALNGMAVPRFASGGLVSSALDPALADATGGNTPLVLDFGQLGRFDTSARQDVAEELVKVFQRAALQRGRR